MNIDYRYAGDDVDWHDVAELFQSVGWGIRDPNDIQRAFSTSSHVIFAWCDGNLVGFGRTVDDGKYYALIVDLVVSPEFQKMGIGSRMLAELRDCLEKYSFTTLTAAEGKEPFYEKQGWMKQKTAFIWPRSEKQRADHAE